jgi:predicted metalloprotease with PDZ domain
MAHTFSKLLFVALLAAATVAADAPKCNGAARECDQQIRQMLSGRRYFGVTVEDQNPGLVVKIVHPNSPAARAGFAVGDKLVAINGKSLTQASTRDFKQLIADARETGRLWVIISRRGRLTKIDARLEPYSKEQVDKIVAAHLSQSHTTTAGAN